MNLSYLLLTADRWGFEAMKQLLSLTWQFALLFAASMLVAYLLKRTSANIRHSVWAAVFVLIPVTALLVYAAGNLPAPRIEVEIMPAYVTSELVLTIPSESSVSEQSEIPTQSAPVPEPVKRSSYPWLLVWALYSLGAAAMLVLVLYGRLKLERIKRRGRRVNNRRIVAVIETVRAQLGISRPVALVESPAVAAPLTVGTVRPVILMPDGFAECLSDTDLRAFAIHELGHVKRFDSLLLMYVSVVRALLYFNPLVWFAARQVSVTAEHACDDLVVDSAAAPVDYAELLVRMARALPHRELTTELAAGFIISKHHFLRRVEEILADRKGRITRLSKKALWGCVLLGIAVVLLIVAVPVAEVQELNIDQQTIERVNNEMNEWIDIVSAEPTTTISGKVLDPDGNPVADATIDATQTGGNCSLTGDTRFSVRTDQDGNYEIKLPPSQNYSFNLVAHDGDVWSVRTWANGITRSFTTTDGERISNMDIRLTRPGTVSGVVVDADGNPAAGHEVKAVTFDGYSNEYYAPSTETDEQGRFEITHVRVGEVLVITPGMTPSQTFLDHAPDGVYQIVDVFPGQTTSGIELIGYGRYGIMLAMDPPSEEYLDRSGELNPGVGTFRARIIDATGKPVAGLRMHYYNDTNGIDFTSDSDGQVDLAGVKLGTATFLAYLDNDMHQRWWSKECVQAEGFSRQHPVRQDTFTRIITRFTYPTTNPLAFEVTENMEPVTVYVHTTMFVSGNVYDPEGNQVEGATVIPVQTGTVNPIVGYTAISVRTDEAGWYGLYLPDSGGQEYNLVAQKDTSQEQSTWATGISEPLVPKTGDWIGHFDITLNQIIPDAGGNPEAGEIIEGDSIMNRPSEPQGVSGDQEWFENPSIHPIDATVEQVSDETLGETYQVSSEQMASGNENVGYRSEGALNEPKFGTFRARIINDKTGEPFPRLKIRYYTAANQTSAITFDADRNGMVELPGVKLGIAQFQAMFENGAGRWFSKDSVQIEGPIDYGHFEGTVVTRLTKPGTNPLAFEVTEDMKPVTIRVQPTMIITGMVYDPEGNPVAGATVAPARSGSGNSITGDTRFSVMTDEDGIYTMYLPDSDGNEYNLVAHDGDYKEERTWANGVTEPFKSKSGEWVNGLDITLTRPGRIRGDIVDSGGNPIVGGSVMVAAVDGLSNRYYEPEGITDEQGRFEINHIRPGEIYVVSEGVFILDKRTRESWPVDSYRQVTVTAGDAVEDIELVRYTQEERQELRK